MEKKILKVFSKPSLAFFGRVTLTVILTITIAVLLIGALTEMS